MSLILYLLQVTCCLAFFYAFYHYILRKETLFETNRLYLVATLAASIVLPLIKIYIESRPADTVSLIAPAVYVGAYVDALATGKVVADKGPFPWDRMILGIYLLGIAVMAVRLLNAVRDIHWIRKHGTAHVVEGHTCIFSDKVKSPFSFFNSIYFPRQHQFDESALKEIVAHELAHVKGRHTLDVLFMETACIFLWPSPLIYFYRKALKDVHEYVADAAVIRDTPWEEYAQLLVGQQQGQLQNILSNQLIYSQLKKRLLMMNQERSGFAARFKYLGIIPVLLIALVLFSFREKQNGVTDLTSTNGGIPTLEDSWSLRFWEGSPSLRESDTLPEVTMISLRNPASEAAASSGLEMEEGEAPVFPGCAQVPLAEQEKCGSTKLWEYIFSNLVYPENLRKAGIEGTVIVKFTVGADGLVKNDSISKSLHPDADEAVLRIVKGMNTKVGKWQPAIKEGKAVDTELCLPVKFALDNSTKKQEPLQYAEELPRFPGCEHIADVQERSICATQKLYEFIYTNINYPKEDRDKNIEGQVIVQFDIGVDGSISAVNVLRSPSEGLKQEAMRVMNAMAAMPDNWIPARNEGKAVAMTFTLPIKFKLQDEQQQNATKSNDASLEATTPTVKVVPNPAQESIVVTIFNDTHTLKIFDTAGKLMITQKVTSSSATSETINISTLKSGQYVVQVISDKEAISAAFAVVK